MAPRFEDLQPEYASRWASLTIRPEWRTRAEKQARAIMANRARYEAVSVSTGVPWHIIGIIHTMECGGSFRGHLHNGDPLTGRTFQVPAGRPLAGKPPFRWEDSAVDAIRYDKLDRVTDWSPERIAYCLETFNGWGYRRSGKPASPYLWSGSEHYSKGKYVRDGVYDPTHVSQQVGGMVLLRVIDELDPEINYSDAQLADAAAAFPKADKEPALDPVAAPAANENAPDPWSTTVNTVSDLAGQGSRLASAITTLKNLMRTVFTVIIGGASAASASPGFSLWAVLSIAIVLGLVVLAGYWLVKRIEKYFLTAANDGRYQPRAS